MEDFLDWVAIWKFFRSFIFGGFAGYVAAKMSQVSADSKRNLVEKDKIENAESFEDKKDLFNTYALMKFHENDFRKDMIRAYTLVGGVSGMIAVNTFNPDATNLQTFAIASIAGASGFAFLKKNMLVDDQTAEVSLHKQDDPVLILLNEIASVVLEDDLLNKEPIIPKEEILEDELIKQEMMEDGLLEDTTSSPKVNLESFPSEIRTFVESMEDERALTDQELRYIKSLLDAGEAPQKIILRFNG